ncbi:MAG: hypothetical protein HEP71_07820 [Roseivirga sp.]|nr:hypothetical protein [Roseivirga sp.]
MKYTYVFFIALISAVLLWTNIKLYTPRLSPEEEQEDIVLQLNFLEKKLKEDDLGKNMQSIFPEGYVFIYALYGLTWAELAANELNQAAELQLRAVNEALYAYQSVDSGTGQGVFQKSLSPEYGIYYSGWRNYLLAKLLSIPGDHKEITRYKSLFKRRCDEIAQAFRKHKSPYLSSYSDQSWPADSFLAIASLAIHDQLFGPVYKNDIADWLQKVKQRLDSDTNMLAHKTHPESGSVLETPRGGSMALMLRLLAEIDTELARSQYALFKQHFVSTALGLPMVREYPKGSFGLGDIDSGPVILGTGFAGTIVSIGTFKVFGEAERAHRQYSTVTAFGLARTDEVAKSYLLGMLPMADAFIAWSRTAPTLIDSEEPDNSGSLWRFSFHLKSLLILILLFALYYRKALITRFKSKFENQKT